MLNFKLEFKKEKVNQSCNKLQYKSVIELLHKIMISVLHLELYKKIAWIVFICNMVDILVHYTQCNVIRMSIEYLQTAS